MGTERDREFTDYVVRRRDALRRAAYLLCRDPYAADDLVQTAVTRLYLAWPRARRADSIDAYAHTVLVRVYVDEHRRGWWRVRLVDREPDRPRHQPDLEGRLDLRDALAVLTPHQRAVLVLRYYRDFSIEQTADALGCSAGTVKSQTSRALAALRRALAPETRS
jgi:RNA polymerase sigma-70 factor (sigma-E family)